MVQITTYSSPFDWPFSAKLNPVSDHHSVPYSRPYDIIKNADATTTGMSGGRSYKKRLSRVKRRLKKRKTRRVYKK